MAFDKSVIFFFEDRCPGNLRFAKGRYPEIRDPASGRQTEVLLDVSEDREDLAESCPNQVPPFSRSIDL
jgi:hypothetical protein